MTQLRGIELQPRPHLSENERAACKERFDRRIALSLAEQISKIGPPFRDLARKPAELAQLGLKSIESHPRLGARYLGTA